MKINRIFFALCLAAGVLLSACDIVEEPVDPNRPPITTGKKVLVEDFTGHQCGNCPRAHETAKDLEAAFGEAVVVVAIHLGNFAEVDSAKGYYNDFNTPFGEAIDAALTINDFALPVGTVNRRPLNGEVRQRHANWSTIVADILGEAAALEINPTVAYDQSTRQVSVETEIQYYETGTDQHHVVVLITEDSISSKQSDYSLVPDYIDPYYQMHVLRKAVTPGLYGDALKDGPIFVGERLNKTFTTSLDAAWVADQCHVIIYVIDRASGEILQVEEKRVVPQ
ncbi:MAG: Omp28-related outer membrane protein [Bacteroidota bacterium]